MNKKYLTWLDLPYEQTQELSCGMPILIIHDLISSYVRRGYLNSDLIGTHFKQPEYVNAFVNRFKFYCWQHGSLLNGIFDSENKKDMIRLAFLPPECGSIHQLDIFMKSIHDSIVNNTELTYFFTVYTYIRYYTCCHPTYDRDLFKYMRDRLSECYFPKKKVMHYFDDIPDKFKAFARAKHDIIMNKIQDDKCYPKKVYPLEIAVWLEQEIKNMGTR